MSKSLLKCLSDAVMGWGLVAAPLDSYPTRLLPVSKLTRRSLHSQNSLLSRQSIPAGPDAGRSHHTPSKSHWFSFHITHVCSRTEQQVVVMKKSTFICSKCPPGPAVSDCDKQRTEPGSKQHRGSCIFGTYLWTDGVWYRAGREVGASAHKCLYV